MNLMQGFIPSVWNNGDVQGKCTLPVKTGVIKMSQENKFLVWSLFSEESSLE